MHTYKHTTYMHIHAHAYTGLNYLLYGFAQVVDASNECAGNRASCYVCVTCFATRRKARAKRPAAAARSATEGTVEASDGRRMIRPGEEYRDGYQGHINLLGVTEVIPPISTGGIGKPAVMQHYPPLYDVFLRARKLGGITRFVVAPFWRRWKTGLNLGLAILVV